ncbi:beta-N-acetylhexosaminidase [Flavitalea sp.]|nr:beta-N-acetylhexosaminidase [Flavitalea sp.]
MTKIIFLAIFSIFNISLAMGQDVIIPRPASMTLNPGNDFVIQAQTQIIADEGFSTEAELLAGYLKAATGLTIRVRKKPDSKRPNANITLRKDAASGNLQPEAYTLSVNANQVIITAGDAAGIYYGGVSFVQLLTPLDTAKKLFNVRPVIIQDKPRFSWRGIMLDCSRTFLSIDYLKRNIDRMSFYKLNTLHLHLTDDQGWRLEIKKRPLLQTKGATFAKNYNEPKEFEGFYSQKEIAELLKYAAARHVTIVPEIEIPGHSIAPLYAYPELSCTGNIPAVFPFFSGPGIANDIFCAGNEGTYDFFKDVLNEVTSLFPVKYVHLGGDEAPKAHWKVCPKCQNKMKTLGLQNEEQLQGYVMNRIGNFLPTGSKRPIGWDEVLDGDNLEKKWIIMAWQNHQRGVKAIKTGYDVVMTPTSHLYFDYNYATTNTEKVYSYEPLRDEDNITSGQQKHVLGIQANFWSHIARTESRIDYHIYPRALALAERAWSDRSVTDYQNFSKRKNIHTYWLNFFDIKYNRKDDPKPVEGNRWSY